MARKEQSKIVNLGLSYLSASAVSSIPGYLSRLPSDDPTLEIVRPCEHWMSGKGIAGGVLSHL